jgi:hypothetical protein
MWVKIVHNCPLEAKNGVTKVGRGVASAEVRDRGRNKSNSFIAGDQRREGVGLGNKIKFKDPRLTN